MCSKVELIKTTTAIEVNNTLRFRFTYAIAPVGEKVFAVLGVDRIRYSPIDSDFGKEIAVRVVKKVAWNVKLVKVGKYGDKNVIYTIPKRFAKILGISKGSTLIVASHNDCLDVFPSQKADGFVGSPFIEPIVRPI